MKFPTVGAAALFGVALSFVMTACSSSNGTAAHAEAPRSPGSSPSQSQGQEEMLKMQIFLDGEGFGPGVIDGEAGLFTRKAAAIYQEARGLPAGTQVSLGQNVQPYANYTVEQADLAALGTMSSSPAAQSKQEKMPYTSLSELLAERFHTTRNFLRKLNPGMNLDALPADSRITVPNVRRPFRYDAFPSTYPAPSEATAKSRRVIVSLSERMLRVVENGTTLAAFPITPGSSRHPAPAGEWRVVGSVPWPWYRHDQGVLSRGERTDDFYNLPPGPNNPVGILWAGLNRPGIGIHGTPVPDTIGRAGSHGCIRLANWDAATFHTLISKGTTVTIR